MTFNASCPYEDGNAYSAITKAFVDGLQINIGEVSQDIVHKTKSPLLDRIHGRVKDLAIKHILVKSHMGLTALWFTLSPEFSALTPRSVL